jgi:hypothetical protein
MFPKKIHQVWFDFDGKVSLSKQHLDLISHTKSKAIEFVYDYQLWSYNDAINFIIEFYPQFISFFKQKIKYPIIKCDFFRYIIMYHFGGVYMDLDFYWIHSLDKLFDDEYQMYDLDDKLVTNKQDGKMFFFEEWYNSANLNNKTSKYGSFHNGVLCSYPNEKFWLTLCIDIYMSAESVINKNDVWVTSGTNKLRNTIIQKRHMYSMYYCKFYVICPFKCVSKDKKQIVHCVSNHVIPLSLQDSDWVFYSLDDLQLNIHLFKNSIGVCVFLNSGSLWMDT